MSNVKSPLRYPGGKQRLAKALTSYLPETIKVYREPFFGGGSFFFHMRQTKPDIQVWRVNDLFEPCANFWQVLQRDPDSLLGHVKQYRKRFEGDGRALHHFLRERFSELPSKPAKAAAYFILNRVSFSGLTFSGGYSEAAFTDRFKDSHIKTLNEAAELFNLTSNLFITNQDYREFLEIPGQDVFIFLDPPYQIDSTTLYGKNGKLHSEFSHEEFAEACKACTEHKWLITYNDSKYIRDLFEPFAKIQTMPVKYSMNSTAKVTNELVITNY